MIQGCWVGGPAIPCTPWGQELVQGVSVCECECRGLGVQDAVCQVRLQHIGQQKGIYSV